MLSTLLGAKFAAALAAGAVGLGGVAAAYAGALPAGLQDLAHTTVGAPAADQSTAADHDKATHHSKVTQNSTAKTAVGPDATGHAAFGLCTAWEHVQGHGKAAEKSVAFANLATAAGGIDKITAYCAKVPHPGSTVAGQPGTHPSGQPSTHLGAKPTQLHSGKPTPLPSGSPSSAGASHRP
jgi:hypothetical protein